ncbi:MAG TPA: hypothetical protein VFN15_02570 [Solirubrobacterales bacterium]|nr:hypothetical protein [Solirubrobacterales bacterium]
MLRELVTRPVSAAVALLELPLTMRRTLEEANELMATSRRQIEAMDRQTGDAIEQAERMNELLARVVKLTEPLEMAQRGSEYFGGALKRAIFGEMPFDAPSGRATQRGGAAIEAEAAPEAETEPLPDAEPEPLPDPEPEPLPDPAPEPLADAEPEPLPDPEPEPGPVQPPQSGIRIVPDPPASSE